MNLDCTSIRTDNRAGAPIDSRDRNENLRQSASPELADLELLSSEGSASQTNHQSGEERRVEMIQARGELCRRSYKELTIQMLIQTSLVSLCHCKMCLSIDLSRYDYLNMVPLYTKSTESFASVTKIPVQSDSGLSGRCVGVEYSPGSLPSSSFRSRDFVVAHCPSIGSFSHNSRVTTQITRVEV